MSSDRIAPQVFQLANCDFDKIAIKDRAQVLDASTRLFTYKFVDNLRSSAQLFCPTNSVPLHVDSWIFKTLTGLPIELPRTANMAQQTNKLLGAHFPLICPVTWTINTQAKAQVGFAPSPNEETCVAKVKGWSICFKEDLLPADYGNALGAMATELSQEAGTQKRAKRKTGPQSQKLIRIADELRRINPTGVPEKPAKEIERDLRQRGNLAALDIEKFSEGTLRGAIKAAKKNLKTNT